MNNDNLKEPWWKPAISLFSQVSTWIVVPIILALVVGKALDRHFGTDPKIFLICAGIGFLITLIGIWKVIGKYMQDIKDIENKK